MKTNLIPIVATLIALVGCDDLAANDEYFQAALCGMLPGYVADCTDTDVQDKARSVLIDGAVEAEIECLGAALGPGGKFASVYYKASRLHDGSCFATVNLSGPNPPNPGFAQSSASELTRRSATGASTCPVTSFHPPQLRSDTSVVNGVIRVEGAFCTTTPGSACTMLVATNCTGLNTDRF